MRGGGYAAGVWRLCHVRLRACREGCAVARWHSAPAGGEGGILAC